MEKVYCKFSLITVNLFSNSSILSIIPDEDEKLTYAHSPKYESDISDAISSLRTRLKREEKINQIIKKKRTD